MLRKLSVNGLHLLQHDLVHLLLLLHELGNGWGNVRRSLLVKPRHIVLIREGNILIEITITTPRRLLKLSILLIILI
jgi:hypothetical protein